MMMQEQNFGVEIELTGITRSSAAEVTAKHYETSVEHIGGGYDAYGATDKKNRRWKAMSDGSIKTTHKVDGKQEAAGRDYSCEVVTPILQYSDIEDLQEIVRELVAAGAVANSSCGIHVHVDGANHTVSSITRLLNFAIGRQDLFYEALQIGARADRWCRKISPELLKALKSDSEKANHSMENIWYSSANDSYAGGVNHDHYNSTRYHGINIHAFFTKGTVEFRLFNGTTHAGKIKAYIQFCLAMSAWSINAEDKMFYKSCAAYTKAQKATLMMNVLTRRLGMTGAEFKTARYHLTKVFATVEEAIA